MLKVLYVAAWGRSGTTIVDNILNEYPNVFSAGELRYLWLRGLVGEGRCGCGEPVKRCALWSDVLDAAFGSGVPDPRQVAGLQERVARARGTATLLYRPWSAEANEYAGLMSNLYGAIGEVTGASLIVDSSKQPAEAAILARASEPETYLLHMVRDPRAVAYSWSRRTMRGHPPARSTVNWLAWNGLTELVAARYRERFRRLRYEQLVADPQGEIESLLDLAGVPATGGPFVDRMTVRLAANHTVSGNPGRFRVGEIKIRDDDEWRRGQPAGARATASAIALPLLARYGYPIWPRPSERSTPGRFTGSSRPAE